MWPFTGLAMLVRPLITFGLALYLATFLPAALACEIAAHSHGTCMKARCGEADQLVDCISKSALSAAPLPKDGDLPPASVMSLAPVMAMTASTPTPAGLHRAVRGVPSLPQRSTLFARAILLRI
jgi:hypothetical protein